MSTARAAAPGRQTASGPSAPVSTCWGGLPGELPWEAAPQIAAAYDEARRQYEHIILLANSIGAYFTMLALGDQAPDRALFVSPVLDMERLILDMMAWPVCRSRRYANGERSHRLRGEPSWAYLCYVRSIPSLGRSPRKSSMPGATIWCPSECGAVRGGARRRSHRPGGR